MSDAYFFTILPDDILLQVVGINNRMDSRKGKACRSNGAREHVERGDERPPDGMVNRGGRHGRTKAQRRPCDALLPPRMEKKRGCHDFSRRTYYLHHRETVD